MVCLIGGPFDTCIWDVASYVLYGILLFVVGIILASFMPLPAGKKLGLGLVIVGLIMAIGFSLIVELWQNSIGFQMAVYGAGAFIIVMIILFPKTKIPGAKGG